MSPRILFVANTLGCGGAEVALMALLDRLTARDCAIDLLVLTGQGELVDRVPENVRLLNRAYVADSVLTDRGRQALVSTVARSFFTHGRGVACVPYALRALGHMVRVGRVQPEKLCWRILSEGAPRFDEKYDLAVAFMEGASTYYVAEHVRARRKAAFVHIDVGQAGYTRQLDRGCYDCMDDIFAVSDETRESFLRMYPEYVARTSVMPNVIDVARIEHMACEPGGFDDAYGGLRILTVGRLHHQKGYDVAIEALALLREGGLDARWYVLGEGPERATLEKQVEERGLKETFVLIGQVQNPYPYYAQCDIYAHCTRFEGKSIAVQEAQILGCPIVVSDRGGNLSQVDDGVDGLVCAFDAAEMAQALARLAGDEALRARLAAAARARVDDGSRSVDRLMSLAAGGRRSGAR